MSFSKLTVSALTEFGDGTSTEITVKHVIKDRLELVNLQEAYIHAPAGELQKIARAKATVKAQE